MLFVSDASKVGGGGSLWQWQWGGADYWRHVADDLQTLGVGGDGHLRHNYGPPKTPKSKTPEGEQKEESALSPLATPEVSPPPSESQDKKEGDSPNGEWRLVCLGHWNWKWNSARQNYPTYEQELLAGLLVLSSQLRILGDNPIVWLCDQSPLQSFPRQTPLPKMPGLGDGLPSLVN